MTGARALAEASIRQNSKSFSLASQLLPAASRAEAVVLYAWCRRVDDAIDLADGESGARRALAVEREHLDALLKVGSQSEPILSALQQIFICRGIPLSVPRDLLAGMEMDVLGFHYESANDLLLYCYRVAGTVGLMMSYILGVNEVLALRQAAHLGMAMQITNICRDVKEDWDRGRMYLPRRWLMDAQVELPSQPSHGFSTSARARLTTVIQRALNLADGYYRSGLAGLPALPFRSAIAIGAAGRIYAAIGKQLARQGFDAFAGRAVVPKSRKFMLALMAAGSELFSEPLRSIRPFTRAALPRELRTDDFLSL